MSDVAEIVVHGRHVEVSRRFRDHVHSKLERIDKFGIPLRRVDVEVSKEANPRLADRAFVLVPLAEIAPEAREPIGGHSIRSLLADLARRRGAELRAGPDPLPGVRRLGPIPYAPRLF